MASPPGTFLIYLNIASLPNLKRRANNRLGSRTAVPATSDDSPLLLP
jgi:hypothetical protein